MNQSEFISKIKGAPWVNRAISFDEVDCYGLVVMYYRHVLGVELPVVAGFADNHSIIDCWIGGIHSWKQVNTPPIQGLLFTAYRGDAPTHVGIVISPTHVLHCRGYIDNPGKVEIHSIRTIATSYGRITYHKLKG